MAEDSERPTLTDSQIAQETLASLVRDDLGVPDESRVLLPSGWIVFNAAYFDIKGKDGSGGFALRGEERSTGATRKQYLLLRRLKRALSDAEIASLRADLVANPKKPSSAIKFLKTAYREIDYVATGNAGSNGFGNLLHEGFSVLTLPEAQRVMLPRDQHNPAIVLPRRAK